VRQVVDARDREPQDQVDRDQRPDLPDEHPALPADDRNLIVTFHYYAPIRFTHQGAPWSQTFSRIGPLDWGSPDDEARAAADFEKVTVNAIKSAFIHFDERIKLIYDVIKPGYAKARAASV